MPISIPHGANHEHLKKQAKQLLKACHGEQTGAARRFVASHPNHQSGLTNPQAIRLQEAQLVVAREYGFATWKQLLDGVSKRGETTDNHDTCSLLILTNGTNTIHRMNEAGVTGDKEEWLEILHEGPVPLTKTRFELNQIRARHFESVGWTSYVGAMSGFKRRERALRDPHSYKSLELWFEDDLYDQLQLVQLIDFLADKPEWLAKTKLLQFDQSLGKIPLAELTESMGQAAIISPTQVKLAQNFWTAFRSSSPLGLCDFLKQDCSELHYLKTAVLRICQEFPDTSCGLGRTERQILSALDEKAANPLALFEYNQKLEEAPYLGDSGFMLILERLMRGKAPLVETMQTTEFLLPSSLYRSHGLRDYTLKLSKTGNAVLNNERDWLNEMPQPYWIGGCHIQGPSSPRWDKASERFIEVKRE